MAAAASSTSVAGDLPSPRSAIDPPSPRSALGDPRFFARLDLNLLRVLVAMARFRSVTEAGRHLSLSQPATSNALARLREAFDDPLFVRAPGALAPTPLAARVAPIVARHLEELEAALGEHQPFDPASSATEWRLSLSDLGEIVFLSAIVEAVRSDAPHTRVTNAAVPVERVADALAHREIDLAVGIMDPRQRGLRSTVLFRERYVALSRRDCPRAWRTRRGFADAPLAVASPTATYHGEIAERIERVRLHSGIVVHARHFSTMPDLVARGRLVAIVPEMFASMACERHDLAMWPIPTPTPRYDVCMVWHGALDTDPAQQWLRERVLQAFGRSRR
ncbi:MAG: LysR family transcriptional regulator [Burkholderiales bacterium]|nr:MAG: LysR family transcriptional regulator [Burkholderiales bacterium]